MHAHVVVARREFTFNGRQYLPGDVFVDDCPGYKLRGLHASRIVEMRPANLDDLLAASNGDAEAVEEVERVAPETDAADDGDTPTQPEQRHGRRRRRSR